MLKNPLLLSKSPEVMGGTLVFAGTRVPVQTLLDYLKAGESINDFLEGFPTVKREQVICSACFCNSCKVISLEM
ncbi:MAG: DUF433 domain-containing protein [Cyanobacteriota bacterium]|nr:DUF433 domain-containing protein [Cyanobacteriota bacterium]